MSLGSVSSPSLVVRGSSGLCLQAPPDFAVHQGFIPDQAKSVKVVSWSSDGKGLAWSNMVSVKIAKEKETKFVVEHNISQTKVNNLIKHQVPSLYYKKQN